MMKPTDLNNPWQTLSSRVVHKNPWLTIYEDEVIKPSGEHGTYTYMDAAPFVLVVAHDGDHFLLVRQYRYPLKQVMTEFPGGSIDGDEQPLTAAQRELQEETGFTAKRWTNLGSILNPNQATVFLAEDLTKTNTNSMKDDGITEYLWLSRSDIEDLIAENSLPDSKTLAALLLFDQHRNRK